ncbi:hypothetical protein WICPIJ_003470 [Wickerhamomyces pijperi]|uniref:Uncharacterized protein n=1 Tax=Wickerhamomyces pijperi TaxID=599730 RepID=A0A9P8Q9U9_WICPI|nr:hypothetical protein WICPIJ_003470 [Wickerhamomyces pijperi]
MGTNGYSPQNRRFKNSPCIEDKISFYSSTSDSRVGNGSRDPWIDGCLICEGGEVLDLERFLMLRDVVALFFESLFITALGFKLSDLQSSNPHVLSSSSSSSSRRCNRFSAFLVFCLTLASACD